MTVIVFINQLSLLLNDINSIKILEEIFYFICISFALGSSFAALIAAICFTLTQKVFYDKLAFQILRISVPFFSAVWLLCLFLYTPEVMVNPRILLVFIIAAFPFPALFFLWRHKKKRSFLIPLAIASLVLSSWLFYTVAIHSSSVAFALDSGIKFLWHNNTFNAPIEIFTLFMASLPFGYTCAILWVVLRRDKDDYGRDYYIFSLHHLAKGALFSTTILFIFLAGLLIQADNIPAIVWQCAALIFALAFLCCILLGSIVKSAMPLRKKPAAVASLFLFLLCYALCALIAGSWVCKY